MGRHPVLTLHREQDQAACRRAQVALKVNRCQSRAVRRYHARCPRASRPGAFPARPYVGLLNIQSRSRSTTSSESSVTRSASVSASSSSDPPSASPSPTSTPQSATETSSATSTPPPSSSFTPPPSSTSTSVSDATTTPISLNMTFSSGASLTTFQSTFVTDINGSRTTVTTPIVTTLNTDHGRSTTSTRTAIIAGAAVGGVSLLIVFLGILFYVRRRAKKQQYSFLHRKEPPSRAAFLAGEDMDDPPYRDHPTAGTATAQHYELPPRLFHASGSGSVFQEAVWPPPSGLADPLTAASSSVDLGRIVDDVMGDTGSGSGTRRLRGGSWDGYADVSGDSLGYAAHDRDRRRHHLLGARRTG
ncbi:hypothetical protein DENSPDRAFT_432476 [Dentipellis sp. KUC8613]|nr:hypothetical protein DENSPDRAFT_432476 [Dentipellis sp. KUC8613]